MTNVVPFVARKAAQAVQQATTQPITTSTIRLVEALLTVAAVDKDREAVEEALQLFIAAVRAGKATVDVTTPCLLKYRRYMQGGDDSYETVLDVVSKVRMGKL